MTNQTLQIFPADAVLCRRKIKKGKEILDIMIQEGDCAWLYVGIPPHYLLNTGPISLPHQEIIYTHRVLCLIGQVKEDPLEGLDGAIYDLELYIGTALHCCDYVSHVAICIGEDLQGA